MTGVLAVLDVNLMMSLAVVDETSATIEKTARFHSETN